MTAGAKVAKATKAAKAASGTPHARLRGTALPRREGGYLASAERSTAADAALEVLLEKLKEVQPFYEEVVRLSSWDGAEGQLALVQSKLPQQKGVPRASARPGEKLTVEVDGVGPEETTVVISCVVPEDPAARPEAKDKTECFTVQLPHAYYPRQDTHVTKALMSITDMLSDMELSHVKSPIGFQNALGLWQARPDHSGDLQDDEGGASRGVSVDELLATVSRIADPSTAAFHHERLGHFGRTENAQLRQKVRGWPGNAREAPASQRSEQEGSGGGAGASEDEDDGGDMNISSPDCEPVIQPRVTRATLAAAEATQATQAAQAAAAQAAAADEEATAALAVGAEVEPPPKRRASSRTNRPSVEQSPNGFGASSEWVAPCDSRGEAEGILPACTAQNKPGPECASGAC